MSPGQVVRDATSSSPSRANSRSCLPRPRTEVLEIRAVINLRLLPPYFPSSKLEFFSLVCIDGKHRRCSLRRNNESRSYIEATCPTSLTRPFLPSNLFISRGMIGKSVKSPSHICHPGHVCVLAWGRVGRKPVPCHYYRPVIKMDCSRTSSYRGAKRLGAMIPMSRYVCSRPGDPYMSGISF